MARPPRVERAGAWHHVTARGNERRAIYRSDRDRRRFLELLGEAAERFAWRIHAYALMDNHFHLLLETPDPNLGRGMQWFNTSYCVWFNRRYLRSGHLLQGRFKSVVVDPVSWGLEVSRYVHLNPARIGRLGLDKSARQRDRVGAGRAPEAAEVRRRIGVLRGFRWSSYRAYLGLAKAPSWLCRDAVLALGGFKGKGSTGDYRRYVESAVRQGLQESSWEKMRSNIALSVAARLRPGTPDVQRTERKRRPSLEQIIEAVSKVKKERWEAFRDRHGDWGRDIALLIGRNEGGLRLRELGEAAGLGEVAVSMAMKRAAARVQTEPKLVSALRQCREELQM